MCDLAEQRDIALEDELRDILTRQIESDDDFDVRDGKTYHGVAKAIAERAAEHFMLAIQRRRAAELTRLRSENAELVVALRMAPSPADYKTLDEYTKAFCHWVEWKRSPALVRAGGSRG